MDSARSHNTWVLIATGIAVLVGGFATMFSVFVRGKITDPAEILRIASAELAADRPEIVEGLVKTVELDVEQESNLFWTREYLLGASQVQQALTKPLALDRRLALMAVMPRLQQADAAGAMGDSRARLGHLLLGKAAFQLGQYGLADRELSQALELDPTAAVHILPELIHARLADPQVPAAKAIEAANQYLKLPSTGDGQTHDAHILAARAWIKAENWDETLKQIELARQFDPKSDQVALQVITMKLAQIEAIRRNDPRAATSLPVSKLLEEALDAAAEVARSGDPQSINQANLLGGRILRQLGRIPAAIGVLSSVRMSQVPAYLAAAGIEEIELLAESGNHQDLLTSTKVIIQEIGSPLLFDNSLMRIEDFRDRLEMVSSQLTHKQAFQTAIDFSKLIFPIVPEATTLALEGNAWKAWADSSCKGTDPVQISAENRQRYQQAGRAWQLAAKLRFTEDDYPQKLWPAIEALQKGGSFADSINLIDDYLRYAPRQGQPRGLLYKGKALLIVGQTEASLPMLMDCIEQFPRDPIRHEAKLLAALANAELGRMAPARLLLEANVEDDQLEPSNPVSRDSLLALGALLYREGLETHWSLTPPVPDAEVPPPEQRKALQQVLLDAIDRLESADERYAHEFRPARNTRYLAALAHRMASHWYQIESNLPDLIDSTRREFNGLYRSHLEAALQSTGSLRKELSQMQESETLTEAEELMLRNCYLTEGDTLFDLNRYEDAVNAYAGVALRYNGEPICLEATIRQGRCYLAMNRPDDATRAFRQAEKNLARIPESQDELFARTTRHDRAGWKAMLQRLTAS